MKLRHVRALAVFGIALVALTGARGSHGASCGGGHSSGSSSSSSGGSDSSSSSGGSSTSGVTSGGVTGGSSARKAERDVRIDECAMSADGKNLVAKLTVTNSDSIPYLYDVTMQFKGDTGSSANLAMAKVEDLKVEAGASKSAEATTPYTGQGNGSEYTKCVVVSADRTLG